MYNLNRNVVFQGYECKRLFFYPRFFLPYFRLFFTSLFKEWLHIRKCKIVKAGRENIKVGRRSGQTVIFKCNINLFFLNNILKISKSPSLAFWTLKLKDHVFCILKIYLDIFLAPLLRIPLMIYIQFGEFFGEIF